MFLKYNEIYFVIMYNEQGANATRDTVFRFGSKELLAQQEGDDADRLDQLEVQIQFIEELLSFFYVIRKNIDKSQDGPMFITTTSSGKEMHVRQVTLDIKPPDTYDGAVGCYIYYMIAVDPVTMEIVGLKSNNVRSKEGRMKVNGRIQVREKKLGVGSAIEGANQVVLQSIADSGSMPVDILVLDENGDNLKKWREALRFSDIPVMRSFLAKKEEEHIAWERIYGPHGPYGLDDSGRKTYNASGGVGPLSKNDVVSIDRNRQKGTEPSLAIDRDTNASEKNTGRSIFERLAVQESYLLSAHVQAEREYKELLEKYMGVSLD